MTAPKGIGERAFLALVALIGLAMIAYGTSPWVALVAGLLVMLVAVLPFRAVQPMQAAPSTSRKRSPLARLSGADLALALPDPIIIFNADGLVVDANRAAHEVFGRLEPGLGLLLKFRAPDVRTLIEQLIEGRTPAAVDYTERVPLERAFRVSGSSVGDDGLFVLVFKDQSEVRRIDRMRADFIANASHELRTPLASVAGFIETLRGPARDDPKAREQFLEIMQTQAGRMARLLDDLLSLSRLEMKPRLDGGQRVDLGSVVTAVVDALAPMADEAKVAVQVKLPDQPVIVTGDRDELLQVVQNLVENACKYGRTGQRVIIELGRDAEGGAELSVTDFGRGIAAEHIPRITERFYRIEAQNGRPEKGTGLGLAIVKHILARHNARLLVQSEPDKETRFSVHFPHPIQSQM